ncbi:MAG: Ig-like domain repeat protein, partial [Acidobacteria bacterium]|nr:Ig-like domain repeat protein [Acidobacteriota bacterium]
QVLPPPLVPTSAALTSSDPQPTSGELITLTATVTPTSGGNGIPTGTVTFQDGSTTLDVITLDQNGAATLSTASLSVGAHTILASYSGDSVFAASSATLSLVVNPPSNVPTQTVVGPSVNPSMYGSSVSFTALVTGDGGTPTGTIIFTLSSAASSVTTAPVSLDSSGQAVFTTAALPTGLVSVVAVYSGDTMFAGSTSGTLNETINQAPTMTAVVSSANPATVGTSINFTATVMSGTSGTPTGSVTFQDGTSNIGSANLDGNGKAQVTLSTLSPGPHNIVASYLGDINFLPSDNSSSPLVETVNQATTTTALTSSLNPAAVGAPVTFSISVTSTGGTPTGSVTLQDGASTLGSAVLNGSAQAQLTISQLNAGSHSIVASYSGDANFQVSTSTSLVETVNQASTVTTLVSSINPASAGAQLIFTASISSSAGTLTPTGSVNFLDGGASIGSAVLSGNGQAQVAVSTLAVGSHTVVASYSGDTNFQTSVSAPLVEVINPATIATATTLASSANPAILNSPITFTATVTSSSDRPTGSVIFQDGGSPIGSATVHLSGHARLTIDSLSVGSHSITAVYSGNGNFQPSLSAPLIETVELPAPPPPAATANLAIAGIESDKNVEPGELLVYVVTVINAGPGAANGVNLSDILPDGTTFVSARATLGSCTSPAIGVNSRIGTLQCNVGSLAKSARWSVFLTVRVTAKPGSTLSNNVSVTSSTSNPNRRNTSATVVTRVLARRSD